MRSRRLRFCLRGGDSGLWDMSYWREEMADKTTSYREALRNVAQARQMAKVAQDAGIQRESLYRALSEDGNPTLETLTAVLEALGLRLAVASRHNAA